MHERKRPSAGFHARLIMVQFNNVYSDHTPLRVLLTTWGGVGVGVWEERPPLVVRGRPLVVVVGSRRLYRNTTGTLRLRRCTL